MMCSSQMINTKASGLGTAKQTGTVLNLDLFSVDNPRTFISSRTKFITIIILKHIYITIYFQIYLHKQYFKVNALFIFANTNCYSYIFFLCV